MGDQLEKFIMDHRDAFEEAAPSQKTWGKIEQKLDRKKSIKPMIWRVAAVLFMASTLVLLLERQTTMDQELVMDQELTQAAGYYTSLISQKKEQLKKHLSTEEQQAFLAEIDQLDAMYLELKKTYQINTSNERVSDALIKNLQLRLEILDRQLEILEKFKNQDNENETTIEI